MEKILYKRHPAMFRNHPGLYSLVLFLIFSGLLFDFHEYWLIPPIIGGLLLFIWRTRNLGVTLTVTTEGTVYRKGVLAKHTNEILHGNVRNIRIDQTPLQRLFNVGKISIASAGSAEIEIEVSGLPSPEKVRRIIDSHRASYAQSKAEAKPPSSSGQTTKKRRLGTSTRILLLITMLLAIFFVAAPDTLYLIIYQVSGILERLTHQVTDFMNR